MAEARGPLLNPLIAWRDGRPAVSWPGVARTLVTLAVLWGAGLLSWRFVEHRGAWARAWPLISLAAATLLYVGGLVAHAALVYLVGTQLPPEEARRILHGGESGGAGGPGSASESVMPRV